jgi:hypothetical protein
MVLPVVNLLPEMILDPIPDLEPDLILNSTQEWLLDLVEATFIPLTDLTPDPILDPKCYF